MAWSTHKEFLNCIQQSWSPNKDLEANKTTVEESLMAWNRETFGNVFHRKKRLLARIKGVQQCLAQQATTNLIKLDRKLRNELEATLQQEELIWYQRSREEWITSGDCNTRFFHIATSVKNNKAKVESLCSDDGN